MRIIAVGLLVLALVAFPEPVTAQSCRFVLGFADLAGRLGPGIAGTCLENQRTLAGDEAFRLGSITITLSGGSSVQRTTSGLFVWLPEINSTQFLTANGYWLADGDLTYSTWEEAAAAQAAPTPTPKPAADPRTAAGSQCFRASSTPLIASVGASPSEKQRLEAESNAIEYLCGKALDNDGPRGVDCFSEAWDAAKGMERVFPGSGMKVYDEKYGTCMGR